MKRKTSLFRLKLQQIIANFQFQGIGLSFILVFSAGILGYNIISVIERGRFNYDTYVYERNTLQDLQARLDATIDEYDYVTSEEYQELLLRDAYSYAQQNQSLFREDNRVATIQTEEQEYFKTEEIQSYSQWWRKLLF